MRSATSTNHQRSAGFTLIELMIAIVLVGVLAAVALPSYRDSVRKGRRSEAFTALSTLQQAQERYRGNHTTFAALSDLPGITANTTNGHYAIAVSGVTDAGYTATATAQGSQAADTACGVLAVRMAGGNISYGAGSSSPTFPDPNRCWAR